MKAKWIVIGVLIFIPIYIFLFNKNSVWVKQGNHQVGETTTSFNNQTNEPNKIVSDDFEIKVFDGWNKMDNSIPGISLMIVNNNENTKDENINRIKFRSYYAVAYILSDKTLDEYYLEYIQEVKDTIDNTSVNNISDGDVNGNSAKFLELQINQQNIDFKTFVAIIKGNNSDFWIISFNTTKDLWKSYDYLIPDLLNSFKIKKK